MIFKSQCMNQFDLSFGFRILGHAMHYLLGEYHQVNSRIWRGVEDGWRSRDLYDAMLIVDEAWERAADQSCTEAEIEQDLQAEREREQIARMAEPAWWEDGRNGTGDQS